MFPAVRLEISVDGGEWTRHRARTVLIGNVGYLQAGMPLLPDAAIDDGVLDVVLLHPSRFLSWIPLAVRVLRKGKRTDDLINRMTGSDRQRAGRSRHPAPARRRLDRRRPRAARRVRARQAAGARPPLTRYRGAGTVSEPATFTSSVLPPHERGVELGRRFARRDRRTPSPVPDGCSRPAPTGPSTSTCGRTAPGGPSSGWRRCTPTRSPASPRAPGSTVRAGGVGQRAHRDPGRREPDRRRPSARRWSSLPPGAAAGRRADVGLVRRDVRRLVHLDHPAPRRPRRADRDGVRHARQDRRQRPRGRRDAQHAAPPQRRRRGRDRRDRPPRAPADPGDPRRRRPRSTRRWRSPRRRAPRRPRR